MILYFLSLVLFVMGLYCLVAKKNIVKKIIGITITEYSINLFLILIGYRRDGIAPRGCRSASSPSTASIRYRRRSF